MWSSPAEIIAALNSIRTTRAGIIAVYCITICEWLDTLSAEVELIHPSKWNSIKLAYFLCRYYPLGLCPLVIFAYVPNHTAQTCDTLTPLISGLILPLAPNSILGVMLMRAYAFTGRSGRVLILLLGFYVAVVGINVSFFCVAVPIIPKFTYEVLGGTGCFPDYLQQHSGTRLVLSKTASSVMDLVSLIIIAIHCLRTQSTRGSLGRIFIRQGLGAFALVLAVHCLALGIYFKYYIPPLNHNGVGLPYMMFVPNLTACRVILDLRRKALPTDTQILRRHSALIDEALALASIDLWVIDEIEYPRHREWITH
ncbi:hypothetical protein GGX14DRAFT_344125 [Mycena pura]|uniref:DUF6533 domain-containing protein n=1 Tax=Mycena pura TaxID=153505 RepID=A0AAD6YW73_9AGAR|nr:hypothetical protein GGX14DRAFT_344125 [Mycena pura]